MRSRLLASVIVIASVLGAGSASAQNDKPVRWHFGGSFVAPDGDFEPYLDDGWGFDFGGFWRWDTSSPLGLRFDLDYNEMDVKTGSINGARVDDGDVWAWSLRVGPQIDTRGDRKVGFVGSLGIGGYGTHAQLTETILIPGWICDPWWGWCAPGLVPGDVIVGERETTKLGYYASGGITIGTGPGDLFIELQYHRVDIDDRAFEYYPITIGYRW
jgi:hypothetical protein